MTFSAVIQFIIKIPWMIEKVEGFIDSWILFRASQHSKQATEMAERRKVVGRLLNQTRDPYEKQILWDVYVDNLRYDTARKLSDRGANPKN